MDPQLLHHESTDNAASLCPGAANVQCCTSSGGGNCGPPNVNAATVALIKEFEGFVKSPAPDPIGLPTVGYGHLCKTKGCSEVPYTFPLTEAQAAALLQTDLKVCHPSISSPVPCLGPNHSFQGQRRRIQQAYPVAELREVSRRQGLRFRQTQR